jgi:hypothetical protein
MQLNAPHPTGRPPPLAAYWLAATGAQSSASAAPRKVDHRSYAAALKGQCQGLDVLDRNEATCPVELERRDVAGFCLNRQTDGPGGGSCLADGANQRPRHPAAPRAGYDVQILELPRTPQPQGCGNYHGRGQASQIFPDMSDKDGQPPVTGLLSQPRERLPSRHELAVVPPVLVKYPGHACQLIRGRFS